MKSDFDKHRDVWGPMFTMQLNLWAEYVLAPSAILANNNQLKLSEVGTLPLQIDYPVEKKRFSNRGIKLNLPEQTPGNYERVKYFDFAAAEYEMATHKFKEHIVQQAFKLLEPYLAPHCRILECACGSGYEAIALAKKTTAGEVVAIDLSEKMIRLAYQSAKEHLLTNMCFFQADAAALSEQLNGHFDIVYCQLSCSYFEDLQPVAKSFYKALRPKGFVFLVEPVADLNNGLSISASKAANPYFERLYEKDDLRDMFLDAGFTDFYWKEILPGIGVSIIKKDEK